MQNSVNASLGKVLTVGPGEYPLSDTVLLPDGITLNIDNAAHIFSLYDKPIFLADGVADVHVFGGTLEDKSGDRDSDRCLVAFKNSTNSGISGTKLVANNKSGVSVYGCTGIDLNNITVSEGYKGFIVKNSMDVILQDNNSFLSDIPLGWDVRRSNGVLVNNSSVAIARNQISGYGIGISMKLSSGNITNNNISNVSFGMTIDESPDVIVDKNYIESTVGKNDPYHYDLSIEIIDSPRCRVSANQIKHHDLKGTGIGVYGVRSNSDDTNVENNTLVGCSDGISMLQNASNVTAMDNTIQDCNDGIKLGGDNSKNVYAIRNKIFNYLLYGVIYKDYYIANDLYAVDNLIDGFGIAAVVQSTPDGEIIPATQRALIKV